MAKEKFIQGKKDEGKHDGRYSNVRREQEAQQHLEAWRQQRLEEIKVPIQDERKTDR